MATITIRSVWMSREHYKSFSINEPWLSKSSVKSYEYCSYQFYLRQLENVKSEPNEAMLRGLNFHDWAEEVFEWMDKDAILNGKTSVKDEITKYIPEDDEMYHNFAKLEQNRFDELDNKEWYFPVLTEEYLYDEDLMYMGTFDSLFQINDDQHKVVDYKTGRKRNTNLSEYRFELYGYKYLIEQNYDYDVTEMSVVFPDNCKRVTEEFKPQTKKAFFRKIEKVREAIEEWDYEPEGFCKYCFISDKCDQSYFKR